MLTLCYVCKTIQLQVHLLFSLSPLYLLCYVLTFYYPTFLLKHGDLCELNSNGFPERL